MIKKIVKRLVLMTTLFCILVATSLYATGFSSIGEVQQAIARYKEKSAKASVRSLTEPPLSEKRITTMQQRHQKALEYLKQSR